MANESKPLTRAQLAEILDEHGSLHARVEGDDLAEALLADALYWREAVKNARMIHISHIEGPCPWCRMRQVEVHDSWPNEEHEDNCPWKLAQEG